MKQIKVLGLRPQLDSIKQKIMSAVEAVLGSTAFINGPATGQFEKEAAECLGIKRAIGLTNPDTLIGRIPLMATRLLLIGN